MLSTPSGSKSTLVPQKPQSHARASTWCQIAVETAKDSRHICYIKQTDNFKSALAASQHEWDGIQAHVDLSYSVPLPYPKFDHGFATRLFKRTVSWKQRIPHNLSGQKNHNPNESSTVFNTYSKMLRRRFLVDGVVVEKIPCIKSDVSKTCKQHSQQLPVVHCSELSATYKWYDNFSGDGLEVTPLHESLLALVVSSNVALQGWETKKKNCQQKEHNDRSDTRTHGYVHLQSPSE